MMRQSKIIAMLYFKDLLKDSNGQTQQQHLKSFSKSPSAPRFEPLGMAERSLSIYSLFQIFIRLNYSKAINSKSSLKQKCSFQQYSKKLKFHNNLLISQLAAQTFSPIKEVYTYDENQPFKEPAVIIPPKQSILKRPEQQQHTMQRQSSVASLTSVLSSVNGEQTRNQISPQICIIESSDLKSTTKSTFLNSLKQLEQYNDIKESLLKQGKLMTDTLFLPNQTSFHNNCKKMEISELFRFKWQRLSEFQGFELQAKVFQCIDLKDYQFFTDIPAFNKIAESLNILALYPQLIEKLFDSQYLNSSGIYYVKVYIWKIKQNQICQDGIWRFILIDDYLPIGAKQIIGYNSPEEDAEFFFWPLLLIKSLAKIYETFQNLATLDMDELISDLTGAPIYKIPKKDIPYRWNELQKALDQNHILLANFNQQSKLREMITSFYGERKSLQISNVYEFQNNGSVSKVIQVKLPGKKKNGFLWNGKWGENSVHWPSVMKKMINVSEKSNGSIFLCFETEFIEIFDSIDIFRICDDYHYQAMQTNLIKNSYSVRTFQLSYPATCYLGCVQQSQRYQRKKVIDKYGECVLFLCKKNVDEIKIDSLSFIQSIETNERNTSMSLYLQPGRYFVVFWLVNESLLKQRICFYYYGDQEIQLERISGKQNSGIFFGMLSGIRKQRNSGPQSEIHFQIEEKFDQQVLVRRLEFRQAKLIYFHLVNTSSSLGKCKLQVPEKATQIMFRTEKGQSPNLQSERNVLLRKDEQQMFLFKYY